MSYQIKRMAEYVHVKDSDFLLCIYMVDLHTDHAFQSL
jgi:hypothetical protein